MTIPEQELRAAAERLGSGWGDADWHALASPSTILALLDRLAVMREALKEARVMAQLMGNLTACGADDEYVWGVQEKINAALKDQP